MQSDYTAKDIQKFWNRVNKSNESECWEWQGAITKGGYGHMKAGSIYPYSHRIAYELAYGDIPDGLLVCHKCDNRKCCNPSHLFLGTIADNLRDMRDKKRHLFGERAPQAKLTDAQVEEIRTRYAQGGIMQKDLAVEYRISRAQLSRIILRHRRQNG